MLWLLSCHKDGKSVVADGEYKGRTLNELIDILGKESLFVTAGSGEFTIDGDAKVLITWVP